VRQKIRKKTFNLKSVKNNFLKIENLIGYLFINMPKINEKYKKNKKSLTTISLTTTSLTTKLLCKMTGGEMTEKSYEKSRK